MHAVGARASRLERRYRLGELPNASVLCFGGPVWFDARHDPCEGFVV